MKKLCLALLVSMYPLMSFADVVRGTRVSIAIAIEEATVTSDDLYDDGGYEYDAQEEENDDVVVVNVDVQPNPLDENSPSTPEIITQMLDVDDVSPELVTRAAHDVAVFAIHATLLKNKDRHDSQAWREIIETFFSWLRNPQDKKSMAQLFELIERHIQEDSGVEIQLGINFSDGECTEMCAQPCGCLEKFRGTCPCGAAQPQSSCCGPKPGCSTCR